MAGSIFADFLEQTTRAGLDLAARSDVLVLERLSSEAEGLFVVEVRVPYLARRQQGPIDIARGPMVLMIRLGPDYLRRADPLETVQVVNRDFFHPNYCWPVLCVGELRPGMPLPMLLRHIYEIVTYQNYATDDGLDLEACFRLRNEPGLVDWLPKPPRLVRRRLEISRAEIQEVRDSTVASHDGPHSRGPEP